MNFTGSQLAEFRKFQAIWDLPEMMIQLAFGQWDRLWT